ncbi:MAG: UDP-N-acetylglucosamine--N-acetylmuramyl-(pentapeptide) pyrophosphoryl-undecaprenol [Patescibacteria group bacterium]|nr:UDP-N-acetylglucosamine--N-acetylmuramyl-(pentapeptide) pyrophosphoryl-undecaprenol [Patescibacteria group bacterium]
MKIVVTGAGGGHFYPLMAVVERVRKEVFIQKLISPDIYFFSDKPYDEKILFELQVKFVQTPAGKLHLYPSLETFTGFFKTLYGSVVAIFKLYNLYPDVVFAKGGYASFPTLLAARLLSIPVIIHESDTVSGRTTTWAGKFASRVAISYPEAAEYFDKTKTALTGQPIRDKLIPEEKFTRTYPTRERPVLLILGGSQGSQRINNVILEAVPELLKRYDIVHQTGDLNTEDVKKVMGEKLKDHEFKDHYFAEGFIDLSLFYPKADFVITRAGSAMFEMALWRLPILVIPIPRSISRDQTSNAYAFASRGLASVLEEENLQESILVKQIDLILKDKNKYEQMVSHMGVFDNSRTAAITIARELIRVCLSHLD